MKNLMFRYWIKSIAVVFVTLIGTALHAQQSTKNPIFTNKELAWIAAHPTVTVAVNPEW